MPKAQQYGNNGLTDFYRALAYMFTPGGIGAPIYDQFREGNRQKEIYKALAEEYGVTEDQAKAIYDQYKGSNVSETFWDKFNPGNWFGGWGREGYYTDWDAIDRDFKYLQDAHNKIGYMPEAPTQDELAKTQQDAYDEIDKENQSLIDLYNQSFQNSTSQLQNEMAENSAMFGDYRNQILTNEAMRQQAIAGSTRYELDRQQRNAIVRGASAAQRLVANINTQLGLQAQSAQQSLDTSNALAQNLLAHRQAQQGIRNSYMNAQNTHNSQLASVLSGQTERRANYGQARKQAAIDDYNYAYDAWNTKANDYFQGNSTLEGIYKSSYGKNKQTSQTNTNAI